MEKPSGNSFNNVFRRLLSIYSRPFPAMMMIFVGLVLLTIDPELFIPPKVWSELNSAFFSELRFVGAVFSAAGSAFLLYAYLQGKTGSAANERILEDLEDFRHQVSASRRSVEESLSTIKDEIRLITGEGRRAHIDIGGEGVKDMVAQILTATLSNEFVSALDEKYSSAIVRDTQYAKLIDDFDAVRSRLKSEIQALRRRANSNLTIGTITTLVAVGSLAFVVLRSIPTFSSTPAVLSYYVPRLSFVVFVEVFAYFFLRLYKANLGDVKFYQNELTNVESRIIALRASFMDGAGDSLRSIIDGLGKTERNFVLKKDETTVELEKSKLEGQLTKEVLERAAAIIGRGSSERK